MSKYSHDVKQTRLLANSFRSVIKLAEFAEELGSLEQRKDELEAEIKNKQATVVDLDAQIHDAKTEVAKKKASGADLFKQHQEKANECIRKAHEKLEQANQKAMQVVANTEAEMAKRVAAANSKVQDKQKELDNLTSAVAQETKKLDRLKKAVKEIVDRSD